MKSMMMMNSAYTTITTLIGKPAEGMSLHPTVLLLLLLLLLVLAVALAGKSTGFIKYIVAVTKTLQMNHSINSGLFILNLMKLQVKNTGHSKNFRALDVSISELVRKLSNSKGDLCLLPAGHIQHSYSVTSYQTSLRMPKLPLSNL